MSGDYSLGTAQGTIKIDYDGKGINQAGQGMDDLETKARKVQSQFAGIATTTGIAATAIAGGIGLAVNAAIDFEKRLSAIGAVSGATADQMEALRAKALQLGADTAFSASESALAMEELVKAGLSVEDVLNGAADATVALAAAGEVALPEAAAIASNAMNQFNLTAAELPKVADLIAGAANASAIDVGEFGFALAQSGAVANLVGVNFQDLATAIALMGNAGIKGSDAGTSLKTMLQNLQPTTDRQIELMKELGIVTEDGTNQFFTQEGKLKSLAEVAGILNTALADSTDAQKALALETIFGTDAIRAAAIIAGEGADGFNEMAEALGNISAKDVAAQRLDNVAGAIEQLKGSVETAAIAFGSALLPVIRKVAEFVTDLVNKFSALDPRWQQLIAFATVAVAALLGVATAIATIGAIAAGIGAAATAGLLPILGIVAAVTAGIALLVAGFILLWKNSETFRDIVRSSFNAVKGVFDRLVNAFKPLVAWFRDELVPAIKEGAKELVDRLKPAFDALVKLAQEHVIPFFNKITDAISRLMPTLIEMGNFLKSVFLVAWQVLGATLGFLVPIIAAVAGFLLDVLGSALGFLIDKVFPLFWGFLKFIVNAFIEFGKAIADAAVSVWNFFKDLPGKVILFLGTLAYTLVQSGIDLITGFLKGIIEAALAVWAWLHGAPQMLLTQLGNLRDTLVQKGKDAINGFLDGLKNVWDFIVSGWLGGRAAAAIALIGELGKTLFNAGKALIQGFWDGMKDIWGSMAGWVEGKMSWLRGLWPFSPAKHGPFSGKGWVLYSGRALMEGFAQGMDERAGTVEEAATRALATVAGSLPTDYSATVRAANSGVAMGTGMAFAANPAPVATSTTSTHHTEINVNVPLEDLRSIKDVQDFLDFVDRLRNDERRGIEVEV